MAAGRSAARRGRPGGAGSAGRGGRPDPPPPPPGAVPRRRPAAAARGRRALALSSRRGRPLRAAAAVNFASRGSGGGGAVTFAAGSPPCGGPGGDSGLPGQSRRLPEEAGSPGSLAEDEEERETCPCINQRRSEADNADGGSRGVCVCERENDGSEDKEDVRQGCYTRTYRQCALPSPSHIGLFFLNKKRGPHLQIIDCVRLGWGGNDS